MNHASYDSDAELIEAFRKGTQHAFTIVYRRLYVKVYWYGKTFIVEEQEVEDIAAECFWNYENTAKNSRISNRYLLSSKNQQLLMQASEWNGGR